MTKLSPTANDPRPLPDIRTGINRGATYGLFGDAEQFMPQVRALGGRFVRVNLCWSQVEPERGRFDWTVADTFFDQLQDGDEAWVTVVASSPWAIKRPTWFLPASPAEDLDRYRSFINELVRRGRGRIRFWQCEIEPCIPMLWSGTPEEYLAHLHVFHEAVKQADPGALVALGGAVPAAMIADDPSGNALWIDYFDRILRDGGPDFDVFDIHPYGDPYQIPAMIQACQRQMAKHGYDKPIAATEFNGPMPTSFRQNLTHLGPVLAAHRQQFLGETSIPDGGPQESESEPAVAALYERLETLPATLRMFMTGCSPDLAAKRRRLTSRDIVTRTLLLLAGGVRRTACFQLAPESPNQDNPHTVRALMFGSFALMDFDGARHQPTADTCELLSRYLDGVREVRRIELVERPEIHLYEVHRTCDEPLLVAWRRCDDFDAEDQPAIPFDRPWPHPTACAVDAFGGAVRVEVADGRLHLPLSVTPVFITPGQHR
ncbi:beta-galactosidase [Saccharopolyspora sp. K220]|uniref:beta-galactosidase n=1 Tax=Saccharopolyspora soli TaxID=2926618 RepID=UPI001F577263|nr:beta-galactosidase [Saccharopolyspora soli]MCI2418802.1 beta-galactosidase [Saccharopolyspora soli]